MCPQRTFCPKREPTSTTTKISTAADISIVPTAKIASADFSTDVPNAAETTPHSAVTNLRQHFNPLPVKAPSPVNIEQLKNELAYYPHLQKITLISSIQEGFDIGYRGPHFSMLSKNIKSAFQYPTPICTNIVAELKEKRVAGPFTEPPLPNFRTSPVGIVPKKDSDKFRTITNLSSPVGLSLAVHLCQNSM